MTRKESGRSHCPAWEARPALELSCGTPSSVWPWTSAWGGGARNPGAALTVAVGEPLGLSTLSSSPRRDDNAFSAVSCKDQVHCLIVSGSWMSVIAQGPVDGS